jgi:hypothetical protein
MGGGANLGLLRLCRPVVFTSSSYSSLTIWYLVSVVSVVSVESMVRYSMLYSSVLRSAT